MPDNRTTKQDLIRYLVERTGGDDHPPLTEEEAKDCVNLVLRGIVFLADNSDYLQISGFGRFQNRARAARTHTNPIQGRARVVPARTVLWFTASKTLALLDEEPGNEA